MRTGFRLFPAASRTGASARPQSRVPTPPQPSPEAPTPTPGGSHGPASREACSVSRAFLRRHSWHMTEFHNMTQAPPAPERGEAVSAAKRGLDFTNAAGSWPAPRGSRWAGGPGPSPPFPRSPDRELGDGAGARSPRPGSDPAACGKSAARPCPQLLTDGSAEMPRPDAGHEPSPTRSEKAGLIKTPVIRHLTGH